MFDEFTRMQILDVAEKSVRRRGYNKMRLGKLAPQIGITKKSLRSHFPKKTDLGLELIWRFSTNVLEALTDIDQSNQDYAAKLRDYARVYEGSLQENKMCLCGMMAAEHETLSDDMQKAINAFFDCHEMWINKILIAGKEAGEFEFDGPAISHAQTILSNLQGALLVSKSLKSVERMAIATSNIIESYRAKVKID